MVEKLGIPVAAIISIEDYEHYRRLLAQEYHRKLGKKLGYAARRQGLTEKQLVGESEELEAIRGRGWEDLEECDLPLVLWTGS